MATSTLGSGTLVLAGTTSGTTTVTATAVAGTTTLTLPAATDTLVGKATTDTLTNKTLTSPTLTGVVTFDAGTAAAPAITTTGDTNTGIFFPAADTIAFAEGGAEVARFDSSGNLGLGVTPSAWQSYLAFQMNAGSILSFSTNDYRIVQNTLRTAGNWKYVNNGFANMYLQDGSSGGHAWFNAASGTAGNNISFTQAMTLDASGRLGIGTTSPSRLLHVKATGTGNVATFESNAGPNLAFVGTESSGRSYYIGEGIVTAGNFSVYDATAGADRLVVDSSGNLLVGTTSVANTSRLVSQYPGNTTLGFTLIDTTSAGGTAVRFYTNTTGFVGSITTSSSATAYNTTSDQRLKENIQNADDASLLIDSLQVRQFDWKADGSHQRYGFIAQELVTVAPEAVHQPINEEDMMAVDYSKLVPMLVKEIQSLRKRLSALESA